MTNSTIAIYLILIVSTLVLFGIVAPIVDKINSDYEILQATLKNG